MIALLLTAVFWGLILWVVWWAVGAIGVPEPFNKVIRVVIIVIAALVAIDLLMQAAGLLGVPVGWVWLR